MFTNRNNMNKVLLGTKEDTWPTLKGYLAYSATGTKQVNHCAGLLFSENGTSSGNVTQIQLHGDNPVIEASAELHGLKSELYLICCTVVV